MNVTREVVKDLLTVYLAGEASADTCTLVEDWMRRDPELARQADQARRVTLPHPAPLPPTVEKRALDRTRRQLRWRLILFGLAAYVSSLPVSVTFSSKGYEGLLLDGWAERLIVGLLAVVLWGLYWRLSRRMRVAGL